MPKKTPKVKVSLSVTEKKKTQKKEKSKKSRKSTSGMKGQVNQTLGLPQYWRDALTMPDIYGPIRIPRFGQSGKTGLAMDRTQAYITGATPNTAQAIVMNTGYTLNPGGGYVATGAGALFTAGSAFSAGQAFPLSNQMDDVCLNSASFLISYLGAPLNASGELIVGTVAIDNTGFTTATYNSLYFYPGVIKVPIASLIDNPLRVYMTKASYDASAFYAPSVNIPDVNRPFVATSNQTVGSLLNVEITRCFEYRTTISSGLVVPYEFSGNSQVADSLQFQEVVAQINSEPMNVQPAVSEYAREVMSGILGSQITNFAGLGATALLGYAGNRMMNRHRNARVNIV
jgi:hypothetical protein